MSVGLPVTTPLGFVHVAHADYATPHASPALKLVVPLDADVLTHVHHGPTHVGRRAVLVPPHVDQAMGCAGHSLALFWRPLGPQGLRRAYTDARPVVLDETTTRWLVGLWGAWRGDLARHGAADAVLTEVAARLGLRAAEPRLADRRLERARAALSVTPGHALELDALAQRVGLSPSRLSHLWAAETGGSLRGYALWLRAEAALGSLLAGVSITQSAHAAGFSDHAHLTRTLRRFFGQPPSYLTARRGEAFVTG